jgi:signal transduction histidine kinase
LPGFAGKGQILACPTGRIINRLSKLELLLSSVRQLAELREASISVSDNSPGIPAEIVDKIFQPFFTNKPCGQGLHGIECDLRNCY